MDKNTALQLKAFLLATQSGDDPKGYISALERTSSLHPSQFKGKLPPATEFEPDLEVCKVIVSTPKRPIIPWWWYINQKEPVPAVVEDIFHEIMFDYALVFPNKSIWIYILVEPSLKILSLLKKHEALRAFILMSIVNKNFKPNERETKRLRLGKLLNSPEINKIITVVSFSENYNLKEKIPEDIPTLETKVDSTGTSWKITFPGKKQAFWSFKELIANLTGSPLQVKSKHNK